jgi:hypothetical protein
VRIPPDAWGFIWVLTAFKAFTTLAILWFAVPWTGAVHFVWIHAIPIFAFLALVLAIPAVFWYRLVRVRAKRRRLIEAEFRV